MKVKFDSIMKTNSLIYPYVRKLSSVFIDRASRVPRLWSNEVLKLIGSFCKGDIINISGWDDRDKEGGVYRDYFTNRLSYSVSNYVGERGTGNDGGKTHVELDLTKPIDINLEDKYDVVFNHTTLEHIFEIGIAFQNLCRMSRDLVIVIVPFAQLLHQTEDFGDYWRFTPQCLRKMFENNGYSVVYESASPQKNAGIYICCIGSRKPGEWKQVFPAHQSIDKLIGQNRLTGTVSKIMSKFRKLKQFSTII